MVGKPKYKMGDIVIFDLKDESGQSFECKGRIEIIDAYGTFRQNDEPSYDIMVENWRDSGECMFVKHIAEPLIKKIISHNEDMGLDPEWRFNSTKKY